MHDKVSPQTVVGGERFRELLLFDIALSSGWVYWILLICYRILLWPCTVLPSFCIPTIGISLHTYCIVQHIHFFRQNVDWDHDCKLSRPSAGISNSLVSPSEIFQPAHRWCTPFRLKTISDSVLYCKRSLKLSLASILVPRLPLSQCCAPCMRSYSKKWNCELKCTQIYVSIVSWNILHIET